jgi:PAS domain S-box-containing protein
MSGDGKMPEEKEFSSTMRIDIPPDLLADQIQKAPRLETAKIRVRPSLSKTGRISAVASPDSRYDQLLQSIYDAALITDLNGKIVDSNIRSVEFLQYSRLELQQLTVLEIISGADAGLINTLCQNLQKEKFGLLQAYCLRKDRSYFPAEIAVNLLKFEDPKLCFFVRDVTLRRQAEEMLRTEHNAIQNAGNGIAIANEEAKLEYVNPAILKMWNYDDQNDLLGHDLRALLADAPAAEEMVQSVLTDHSSWLGELVAKRKDGSVFEIQVSAACNRDTDGEVAGMVVSFVDISDRKRVEEALRQTERQRVMLASVGAACHHLGQPATVIMTNLELIKRMTVGLNNEGLKDILRMTNEAADSLADVLHKLNSVNEFKTVQYLDTDNSQSPENVILDI